MRVMIAGGGSTGAQLAAMLLANHHEVLLVENRRPILEYIHKELPTENIYEGDYSDPVVLDQAGLSSMDVFAACTHDDDVNLVLCNFAKTFHNVGRTIARVNNPHNAWLFNERFHVDYALNAAQILASMIEEEMVPRQLVTLLRLAEGRYALVEEDVPTSSPAAGRLIRDLDLTQDCVIAGVLRNGELIVPRGDTQILVGDKVLSITDQAGSDRLDQVFGVARANEANPGASTDQTGLAPTSGWPTKA